MNPILFMIGGWPVHITDVVIGFAAATLLLLLTITIVVARSGKRGSEFAMMQATRADELEQRLNEMLRAQAESSGRVDAMAQA
ncbi:MAG: DNA recombination protein RmuC, partial [Bradyrhizobium sp.]